ncbi:hypothetical protein [Luteimonas sp. 9C]|uniref:hypothetical protein n=1 Tax=Luteimonas sp. 9C TaxID=2653148 RepID=UPI00135B66BF|nr:hypothetical protein [Luteimonas sp. 9C]
MGSFLAVVQLAAVPLLIMVALAVRSAGSSKPLNGVDYARIASPAALHRWAGSRMLLLPAAFLVGGLASFRSPGLALLFLGAVIGVCLCVGIWIAPGAERFQGAP